MFSRTPHHADVCPLLMGQEFSDDKALAFQTGLITLFNICWLPGAVNFQYLSLLSVSWRYLCHTSGSWEPFFLSVVTPGVLKTFKGRVRRREEVRRQVRCRGTTRETWDFPQPVCGGGKHSTCCLSLAKSEKTRPLLKSASPRRY